MRAYSCSPLGQLSLFTIISALVFACSSDQAQASTAPKRRANPFSRPSAGYQADSDQRRLHLPNMESNDKLWALLQYESTYGRIDFNSLRAFGDYSHSNLRAVKAVGFRLENFNFSNADLRGADFRGADLRGANFTGADLREVVLISARMKGCYFDQHTKLPFSREEALKNGWQEAKN